MSDATTHLLLPYILAAQAQKHVTHNEALQLLDTLVQAGVEDRSRSSPPAATPAEGERLYDYFVAQARAVHPQVATGRFGADMQVHLVNDGPVTIPLRMVPTGT